MINMELFQFKSLGSFALRCGCNAFGVRTCGGKVASHLVFIFVNRSDSQNFKGWLNSFLTFQSDFYSREVYHKGRRLFLVFVNCHLHIKTNQHKLYFKSFRNFCKAPLTVYNKYIVHPNKSASLQRV